jgi:hypothetical protein
MNRDNFADFLGSAAACVHGGSDSGDISADYRGNESSANFLIADQIYLGRLHHGVRGFHHSDKTSGFDHSQGIGILVTHDFSSVRACCQF